MKPRLVVIIGVFFVSFSSILVRLSQQPPLVIATYRLGFSVLFLLPAFIRGSRAAGDRAGRGDFLLCAASGLFLALHFYTYFLSLSLTTVAASTVLVNIHPVIIVISSFLILKERIAKRTLLFIGVTFVGSFVIALGDYSPAKQSFIGDGMAFLGALFVSGYLLIGRVVRRRMALPLYTFTVYGSSTIILLLLDAVTRTALFPLTFREILIFLALALFCTILGHTLFNWALRYVEPAFVSTAVLGEPVVASVLALLLFGETPPVSTLVGGLLVIAGIYFSIRGAPG
jgi:drug/metabolite transporter (DMT)-like permease